MKTFPSTIVIADDDEDDIFLLDTSIKAINPDINITTARNGLKLLMILNNLKPDIIFLDINMPVKDGLECLRELRANEKLSGTRVVIYSTSNNTAEIELSYNLGADYYFIKPDLQSKLNSMLAKLFTDHGLLNNIKPHRDQFVLE